MIRLVWCCASNPLGETAQRSLDSLDDCRAYIAAGNIPADSAGYTAYQDTGTRNMPTVLLNSAPCGEVATW